MGKSTPTSGGLASPTRLWVWGWRWALRTSQCSRMAKGSNCCGRIQRLSKDPSECLHLITFSERIRRCKVQLWMNDPSSSSSSFSSSFSMDLHVTKDRSLMVTLKDSVKFVILLHKVWEKHPYHRDYLGFYTLDSHLLSSSVHGLLGTARQSYPDYDGEEIRQSHRWYDKITFRHPPGQFYHGIEFEVSDLRPGEVPEKPDATMFVKGQELNVTRYNVFPR